jgi:acetyl esterase/lipase
MKYSIRVDAEDDIIFQGDNYVFGYRRFWANAVGHPLCLTLLRPRNLLPFDRKYQKLPMIVFLCGGGWTEMDRKVWLPELAWFAKKGYAVASVDYSVAPRTRFPQQIEDVKLAIRWLRAHAEEFSLDPGRFSIMGESAGGYLAALAGLTNKNSKYDAGEHLDQSSAVNAAIVWYPPIDVATLDKALRPAIDPMEISFPACPESYDSLLDMVAPEAPPFLILHGDQDSTVPLGAHGLLLHDALESAGNYARLYVLEGAGHGDPAFVQEKTKLIMLEFLNEFL